MVRTWKIGSFRIDEKKMNLKKRRDDHEQEVSSKFLSRFDGPGNLVALFSRVGDGGAIRDRDDSRYAVKRNL